MQQNNFDNCWMYRNRHELAFNLQKNDNYSRAVLPDSYKQLQNGRYPVEVNNYMQARTSVANSYQNDQHRIITSQCVWPTSVYSVPYRSSQANNCQSREDFLTYSNTFNFSQRNSQSQQNNGHFSQVHNNNKNQSKPGSHTFTRNNNANPQAARIRVKDVFSLNNCSLNNPYSDSNVFQGRQNDYVLNYLPCESEIPSEYVDFEKVDLSNIKHHTPPPPYRNSITAQTLIESQQQFLYDCDALCQKTPQCSSETQYQYNRQIAADGNYTLEASPKPLLHQFIYQKTARVPKLKNCHDSQTNPILKKPLSKVTVSETRRTEITSSDCRSNSFEASGRIKHDSQTANSVAHSQVLTKGNLPKANYQNISQTEELKRWRKGGSEVTPKTHSSLVNEISSQKNDSVKIAIPHTGQSSFINLSNNNQNSNSNFSLPSLLDSNNKKIYSTSKTNDVYENQDNIELNLSQTNLDNVSPSPSADHSTNISNLIQKDTSSQNFNQSNPKTLISPAKKLEFEHPKKPSNNQTIENDFINSNCSLENIPSEVLSDIPELHRSVTTETAIQNALKIKEENECTVSHNITDNQIPPLIIKKEKNNNELEKTLENSENLNPSSEGVPPQNVDGTENLDVNKKTTVCLSKRPEPKSKTVLSPLIPAENHLAQLNTETGSSKGHEEKDRLEGKYQNEKKVVEEQVNYWENNFKSKINREKLDLLIKFLQRDEVVDENKYKGKNEKTKKNRNSNYSRRKLSKTCIVKNKNNSREMVSLLSHKIAREEILKSPCKTPQVVSNHTEMKPDEKKSNSSEDVSESEKTPSVEEGLVQPNKPCLEEEVEDDGSSDSENTFSKQCDETIGTFSSEEKRVIQDEKSIINIMRAFQNLKTHFCMSCNLVSSIESFWINAISGELRCLNCFKKMTLKAEEKIFQSEALGLSKRNTLTGKLIQKDLGENASKQKDEKIRDILYKGEKTKSRNVSMFELDFSQFSDVKENDFEPNESCKSKNTSKSSNEPNQTSENGKKGMKVLTDYLPKKKQTPSSQKGKSFEEQEKIKGDKCLKSNKSTDETMLKGKVLSESSKKETHETYDRTKRKSSKGDDVISMAQTLAKSPIRASSSNENVEALNHSKYPTDSSGKNVPNTKCKSVVETEIKKLDSPSINNNNSTPKETFPEEYNKKEKNEIQVSTQYYRRKRSNSKEEFVCNKVRILEDDAKKLYSKENQDQNISDKKKSPNVFKENSVDQLVKTTEQANSLLRKDSSSIQIPELHKKIEPMEQLRKRKNSDENSGSNKVRFVEEHSKREIKHYSEQYRNNNFLKEDTQDKNKELENNKDCAKEECWVSKDNFKNDTTQNLDKSKTKDTSKKESPCQKISVSDHSKTTTNNSLDRSRRKSKDECGIQVDKSRRIGTTARDEHVSECDKKESKQESFCLENKDRKYTEEKAEKDRKFLGKIPKISHKNSKRDVVRSSLLEKVLSSPDEDLKHLREDQYVKVRDKGLEENLKNKEKGEKFKEKEIDRRVTTVVETKKSNETFPSKTIKKDRKDFDSILEKKLFSEKDISDVKHSTSETVQTPRKNCSEKDGKVVQYCNYGMKDEDLKDTQRNDSENLLAKLMKKTKKLSWSLLEES